MVDRGAGGSRTRLCLGGLLRCEGRRHWAGVCDCLRVCEGTGLMEDGQQAGQDPRSRWCVLRQVLHDSVEPVVVQSVLIEEEEH